MTRKLGVVMDSIASIHFKKDSTLAMLLEASKRGYEIFYFELGDLFLRDGIAYGSSKILRVFNDSNHWYELENNGVINFSDLDLILMRKDPPFNLEYIYATYILEKAEENNVLVVNKPQTLRDANEKMYTAWFPQCCPETLVTRSIELLKNFLQEQKDIVCKPLDTMGGSSVFRMQLADPNINVILETLTNQANKFIMAQRYIPEITQGDKRILMIDGEPIPYALSRVPSEGEWRGNLAAGAKGIAQSLSKRDKWICEQVGPILRDKGLHFVGLDVIGDYLTEINVTSPTCIRELDEQCELNISATLFDSLEKYLPEK